MLELKEGETYHIKTLDDLFNCPVNMMEECLQSLQKIFIGRINRVHDKGKDITIIGSYLNLTNDGDNSITLDFKELLNEN